MEEKKKTVNELTLLERLQYSRVEVQNRVKKKTGKGVANKEGTRTYSYWQQKDFIPYANEVFAKYKITPVFNIYGRYVEDRYVEVAELVLYDALNDEKKVVFTSPTANPTNLVNPIQQLGGKQAYVKRYLYLNALELAENVIEDVPVDVVEYYIDQGRKTKRNG